MSGQSARRRSEPSTGEDLDRVYYYTIFPSLLLSLHPDYVMVHYAKPLAADRTARRLRLALRPADDRAIRTSIRATSSISGI